MTGRCCRVCGQPVPTAARGPRFYCSRTCGAMHDAATRPARRARQRAAGVPRSSTGMTEATLVDWRPADDQQAREAAPSDVFPRDARYVSAVGRDAPERPQRARACVDDDHDKSA